MQKDRVIIFRYEYLDLLSIVYANDYIFFLNPFGYIQKNNPTLEHYIRNVYKTMEVVFYDINIGIGIARTEETLAFMFVPYEMLILSVFKKFRIPISLYFLLSLVVFPYCLPTSWVKK